MSRKYLGLVVVLAVCLAFVTQAGAVTKQITVKPGWNLLNLPIEPTNKAPSQLLSGLNFASVWSWNAAQNKWRVYLGSGDQATTTYAQAKGFEVLTQINAGDGFWVNSSETSQKQLTIEGSAPTSNQHNLAAGWNLIGLKSDQSMTVSALLNLLTQSGVNAKSLWSWDTGWNVFIPSFKEADLNNYATSKGFNILNAIASTDGFWVNASTSGSVTETPPEVGKAFKATGDNTYIPLANADVYVNGVKIGTTDSNGNFKLPDNLQATDVITIGSEDQFTISASQLKNGMVYLFAQEQDTNKVALEKTGGPANQKAVFKTISSKNKLAWITISDMGLTKDITVAVTPYASPLAIPQVDKIKEIDPSYVAIAGADISVVEGKKSLNLAGPNDVFTGKVYPSAKNFFGDFTGEALYNYLGLADENAKIGEVHLLAYQNGTYTKVANAKLEQYPSQTKKADGKIYTEYYLTVEEPIKDILPPYVFVLKQNYLMGTIKVKVKNSGIFYATADAQGKVVTENTEGKGAVISEDYGSPVKGALVTTDNSDQFGVTDEKGEVEIKYLLPPTNPYLGIIVKKDGYIDAVASFNVLDEGYKEVGVYELPDTAAVGGKVYDSTKGKLTGGIAGAKVTLKNPVVLDKIIDNGDQITVGLDSGATYLWEVRKQAEGAQWFTVLQGKGESGAYSITRDLVKQVLIENKDYFKGDPSGTYDVRITVDHAFTNGNYVESAQGYLDITIDMAAFEEGKTGNLSQGQLDPQGISVFGGINIGYFTATGPIGTVAYTWTSKIILWDDVEPTSDTEVGEEDYYQEIFGKPIQKPYYPFMEAVELVKQNYLELLSPMPKTTSKTWLEDGITVRTTIRIKYPAPPGYEGETDSQGYVEDEGYADFDLKMVNPLESLIVGKLQIIPNTTMAFEETQTTKEDGSYLFAFVDPQLDGLLGIYANAMAYKPSSIFLGTQYPLLKGWITEVDIPLDPVEVPPQPGAEPEPIDVTQAAALAWVETWENGTQVSNGQQISTTNGLWTVEGNDLTDVQWWLVNKPENMGPAAIPGIDYPVPADVPNAQPNLLPAYEGENVAWFGSKTTFTFSDSGFNTSNGFKEGELISPEIDLTNFSFATLEFATWWEVESVDVAKWQFDQMKVQVTVLDITETTELGGVAFAPGEWKTVAWLNPDSEVPIQQANINYSSGGNDAVPIWVKIKANLNPFAGHKIKIRFYFNSVDFLFNGFRGWAVDEIKITNEDSGLPFTTWGEYWWWKPAVRSE